MKMSKLKTRLMYGTVSNSHFHYIDSSGQKWSLVDFVKMMELTPFPWSPEFFYYSWEGMAWDNDDKEIGQYRGNSAEEVIEQIEQSLLDKVKLNMKQAKVWLNVYIEEEAKNGVKTETKIAPLDNGLNVNEAIAFLQKLESQINEK